MLTSNEVLRLVPGLGRSNLTKTARRMKIRPAVGRDGNRVVCLWTEAQAARIKRVIEARAAAREVVAE